MIVPLSLLHQELATYSSMSYFWAVNQAGPGLVGSPIAAARGANI